MFIRHSMSVERNVICHWWQQALRTTESCPDLHISHISIWLNQHFCGVCVHFRLCSSTRGSLCELKFFCFNTFFWLALRTCFVSCSSTAFAHFSAICFSLIDRRYGAVPHRLDVCVLPFISCHLGMSYPSDDRQRSFFVTTWGLLILTILKCR